MLCREILVVQCENGTENLNTSVCVCVCVCVCLGGGGWGKQLI